MGARSGVDFGRGRQSEAGVGRSLAIRQTTTVSKGMHDIQQHVIKTRSLPSAQAGQQIFTEAAGDPGGFSSGDGEAHVANAGRKISLSIGIEKESGGNAVILRDPIAQAPVW